MLGFSPISTTPISSLPRSNLGEVEIVGRAIVAARLSNPLADLISDPKKQFVLAVEISAVGVDV